MRARGFQVERVCRVLRDYGIQIAARTYRAFKKRAPSARSVADAELTAVMKALRETPDAKGRLPRERFYGRRKMHALMVKKGHVCGEEKIGRLMRLAGMAGLVRGRRITTTRKTAPSAGDLLNRQFAADAPNQVWVADLTYVRTLSGWVYVGFITDAYARKIVGCDGACSMTQKLVSDTLAIAIDGRAHAGHPVGAGLVHHADHGSQYTSVKYGEQLMLAGITGSFGAVGDSYDNALAETVNGLYKAECADQDGPFATLADVMDATLDWVRWYNSERLHEYLNYSTPDEAEAAYYSTQQPLETQ